MRFFLTILMLPLAVTLFGQEQKTTIFDEGTVIYRESVFGGGGLHTMGLGGHITYGKNLTAFKSRIYQLDLVTVRHPREIRTYNSFYDDSRSYIYGKLNHLFILRPTFGNRYIKYDKIRPSGVAVGYSWRMGPSLGFSRPVYLEIIVPGGPFFNVITERYDPLIHSSENIYGRAGFLRGFNELRLHPGLHGAFALNFEYDPRREGIKGLEVGCAVDFYPEGPIEIMAFSDNLQTYITFYVHIQVGKRYNR